MVEECRNRNIKPILVFMPQLEKSGFENEAPIIMRIAREAGFIVLDLSDVFQGYEVEELRLAEWDAHPSAKGHALLANRLYEVLNENAELVFPAQSQTAVGQALR